MPELTEAPPETEVDEVVEITCDRCETIYLLAGITWEGLEDVTVYEDSDDYSNVYENLCQPCIANLANCYYCGVLVEPGANYHEFINDAGYTDGVTCCDVCFCDSFYFCDYCGNWGTTWNSEWERCEHCMDHVEPSETTHYINSWNFKPNEFRFWPIDRLPNKRGLFMGMELEVSFKRDNPSYVAAAWGPRLDPEFWYIKSDSSVYAGWELVTHPFDPWWGVEEFPFDTLEELTTVYEAYPKHRTCGTHIHLNKSAFTDAHLWKLFQVHQRQSNFCGMVGGRGTDNSFGRFDNLEVMRQQGITFIRSLKEGGVRQFDRYSAINPINNDTLELRYPEGDVTPKGVKKHIEWVMALWDFTKYIKVEDIKKGVLDDPGYLLGWIVDRKDQYPTLEAYVSKQMPTPKHMPDRSY